MTGLQIDVDRSMVRLADQWFPAVGLLCPPYGDDPDPEHHRLLGCPWRQSPVLQGWHTDIHIPLENGVLVSLNAQASALDAQPRIDVWLHHPRCILSGPQPMTRSADSSRWLRS